MSYIRLETADKLAQTTTRRQKPQVSIGAVFRGGSIPEILTYQLDRFKGGRSVKSVPHDWLFPHMAAVVHHGEAGTVEAGLRAAEPTVVCPFVGDQPFWGKVIHKTGVGPKPIQWKKLSVENLAAALRVAISDAGMRQRAAALGEKIRAEDGVGRAVEFINEHLRRACSRST